jgi:hypothetical protein
MGKITEGTVKFAVALCRIFQEYFTKDVQEYAGLHWHFN